MHGIDHNLQLGQGTWHQCFWMCPELTSIAFSGSVETIGANPSGECGLSNVRGLEMFRTSKWSAESSPQRSDLSHLVLPRREWEQRDATQSPHSIHGHLRVVMNWHCWSYRMQSLECWLKHSILQRTESAAIPVSVEPLARLHSDSAVLWDLCQFKKCETRSRASF